MQQLQAQQMQQRQMLMQQQQQMMMQYQAQGIANNPAMMQQVQQVRFRKCCRLV